MMNKTPFNEIKTGDILLASILIICVLVPDNYCFSSSLGVKFQILIYAIIFTLILRLNNIIHFSSSGIIICICICALIVNCVIMFTPYRHTFNTNKDDYLFIVYSTPFFIFLISKYFRKKLKIIFITLTLILFVYILISSNSRAFLFAFILETSLYVILSQNTRIKRLSLCLFFFVFCATISYILYKIRPASVIGRFLIWKICYNIISNNWLIGLGHNGFVNNYMLYQKDYLQENSLPLSIQYLVDDITTPYNEFLLLLIEHGLVVFIPVLLLVLLFTILIIKKQGRFWILSICGICAIFIISFFSYPFRSSITWSFLSIFLMFGLVYDDHKYDVKFRLPVRIMASAVLCFLFSIMVMISRKYYYWHKTSISSNPIEIIATFKELNTSFLGSNPNFLYDYAYWLYQQSSFKECEIILEKKESSKNYRNMMFLGEVHHQLKKYDESIECYRTASQMIPNRFSPLFNILSIYEELNDERLFIFADSIISKPIKIPSKEVSYIKDYCIHILTKDLKSTQ